MHDELTVLLVSPLPYPLLKHLFDLEENKPNIGNGPIISRGVETLKKQCLENTSIPTANCVAESSDIIMHCWPCPLSFPVSPIRLSAGTLMPRSEQAWVYLTESVPSDRDKNSLCPDHLIEFLVRRSSDQFRII